MVFSLGHCLSGNIMARAFKSIFKKRAAEVLEPPALTKPLMRVLEPRVLLDAAAVETAIDIAGQAAHSQLADDFVANSRMVDDADSGPVDLEDGTPPLSDASLAGDDIAENDGISARRTDREIVFIDANVEDREDLISSFEPGVTVHVLDGNLDGVEQIAAILEQSGGYDAVHIFSHGGAGQLELGNAQLTRASMGGLHASALERIGGALGEDGDILIYGCNFGQGVQGQLAAEALAKATGADVAASDDLTGAESLAGDWDLEVQVGQVERVSFSAPNWNGILGDFTLEATPGPTLDHVSGGVVGTPGSIATWSNAASFDPGGGGPVELYDVRATILSTSGATTATFESTSSGDGSLDDFQIIVTNLGSVTGSVAGEEVLEEGTVTVFWEILVAGTEDAAPQGRLNLALTDIDGLGGAVNTKDAINIFSDELYSYTVETGTHLVNDFIDEGLELDGTENGTDDPLSQVSLFWANTNQFAITYKTHSQTAEFTMDGDGGVTFVNPETRVTQNLDLNGVDPGNDYVAVYVNGADGASDVDVPLALVDVGMEIYDLDSKELDTATITLTNAFPGDKLNFDTNLLSALGISTTLTDTGAELILELEGPALISNFETAIKSVTYSNDNPDGSFERGVNRIISFEISDGLVTTTGPQTVVFFGSAGQRPVAGSNVYVEDEDTTISTTPLTGLLADDRDPQDSSTLFVSGGFDSLGRPIPIDAGFVLPSGALLTLRSDGSFDYVPVTNYSGNETITYVISDGVNTAQNWATFDIQPVLDTLTTNIVQNSPVSSEDFATSPISITTSSSDPSENQMVTAENIPLDVVITDGTNSFRASEIAGDSVDISEWDRSQIRILPRENDDRDVNITFVMTNIEIDGSESFESQVVTFQVDAVADIPLLEVDQAIGAIDADVPLADVIMADTFDQDFSEEITDITISNLPAGGEILIDDVIVPKVGNSASFELIDLPDVVFRPPQIGASAIYDLRISVTSSEVAAENGVQTADATISGILLRVDLNDSDDPVVAVDDDAVTFAGESVNIDVISNDLVPDGDPRVTQVNGQAIDLVTPITLPGGEGVVRLALSGDLIFEASTTFSGEVVFSYTLEDADFSSDQADVRVSVQPRWSLNVDPSVEEGDDARFFLTLEGAIPQGDVITVDLSLVDGGADSLDHGDLVSSVNNSIAAMGQDDFSFDGTTLTYTAPPANYGVTYDPAGSQFNNIAGTGTPLGLGDDGLAAETLPFSFPFYGQSYDTVYVSANGYVTFGSPVSAPDNASLDGNALAGRPIIAPFWDDLETTAGDVYFLSSGSTPGQREFIIQWEDVSNASDGAGTGQFQIVLSEATGEIRFNYQDVEFAGTGDNGAGATIGLQGLGGAFDEFSFNQPLSVVSGSSLIFSPGASVNPTLIIDVPIVDDPDFEIDESFRIELSNSTESAIGQDQGVVTIQVSDNLSPIAVDDSLSTTEESTAFINVLTDVASGDSDPEGHALSLAEIEGVIIAPMTSVTLASGAVVTAEPDGQITYNPNGAFGYLTTGQNGVDTFNYIVRDAFGGTDTGTVTVNIDGVNQLVTFDLDDAGVTPEQDNTVVYPASATQVNVTAANAVVFDPDNSELTAFTVTLGGFQQAGNEKIRIGAETFEFGTAYTGTVTIGGAPDTASPTTFSIAYDGGNNFTFDNVAPADMPRENIELLIRTITYENDSSDDVRGLRTMTFAGNDGNGIGPESVVTIDVRGNNLVPIAGDDGDVVPFETPEETSITVIGADLMLNDSDGDGDMFSIVSVNGGANGTAVLDGSGNITFTPALDFNGLTSFTYTIEDTRGGQGTGSVFVNVTPINDAPIVDLNGSGAGIDYNFTYVENDVFTPIIDPNGSIFDVDNTDLTRVDITMTGGQIGDRFELSGVPGTIFVSIIPSDALTGLLAPGNAVIQLTGTADVSVYQSALESILFDSTSERPVEGDRELTITASDGALTSVAAVTTITVVEENDAPDVVDDTPAAFDEDTTLTLTKASLLANDSDLDGDVLDIVSVQDATFGTVEINLAGDIVFTPTPDHAGNASFTYTVEDSRGAQTTGLVMLTVSAVNDATIIDLDFISNGTGYSTDYIEDAVGVPIVDASVRFDDIDSPNLVGATITLTNGQIGDILETGILPVGISASVVPSGALVAPGTMVLTLSGPATLADYETALQAVTYRSTSQAPSEVDRLISVQVDDGEDPSNVAISVVSVTATNDVPIAADDDSFVVDEDTLLTILHSQLLANDIDPDGDALTIVSVQDAENGSVSLGAGNVIEFTPATNYFGPAHFTYTIDDGNGEQHVARVDLTVSSVNDATVIDLDDVGLGNGFTTAYEENQVGVQVVGDRVEFVDVDDSELTLATITLTNGQVGDILEVGALPPGISVTIVPNSALVVPGVITVTLSGTADFNDYRTALEAVTYRSVSERPSEVQRTVSVSVFDGDDQSNTEFTTIAVTGVNDDPVVQGDGPFSFDEDTVFEINPGALLFNDSDPDLDSLMVVSVQDADQGTVEINGLGNIVFTPQTNYAGPASFTYTVDDGNGGIVTARVDLNVLPVNDAPVVDLDDIGPGTGYITTYIENAVAVPVVHGSVEITDVDHSQLTGASIVLSNGQVGDVLETSGLPAGISASFSPASALVAPGNIVVTLTGTADFDTWETALASIGFRSISDNPVTVDRSISVFVNDGQNSSVAAISTIEFDAVNDAPTAGDDGPFSVDEDTVFTIVPAALLFNDSDPENDGLTIVSVQDAVNGSVEINLAGQIVFTPNANYFGVASFTYTVDDGNGATSIATVDLVVNSINDLPSVDLNGAAGGSAFSVTYTENDLATTFIDPTPIIMDVESTNMVGATVTLINGFVGDVLETGVLPAGITASITPPGGLIVNGPIVLNLSGPASLADYETALAGLTFRSTSDNPDTTSRSISVSVNDGQDNSPNAFSNIDIVAENDDPVAVVDGVFTFDEDTLFTIAPTALTFNDSDAENNTLSIASVQDATNGSVVINGAGQVVFTPVLNYSGTASFSYTVDDGNGGSATATVDLDVVAVNDLPTLDLNAPAASTGNTVSFEENDPPIALVNSNSILGDVDDPDIHGATFVLTNGQVGDILDATGLPPGVSVNVAPSGALTVPGPVTLTLTGIASQADYKTALEQVTFGSDSDNINGTARQIDVTINDGEADSVAARAIVVVNIVNDAPIPMDDGVFAFDEDTDFTIQASALLFNDIDPENDTLTVISVQNPTNGSVVMDGSGLITFTPNAAYHGLASFDYTVEDSNGARSMATVDLEVRFLNDAPILDLNGSPVGIDFAVTYTENDPATPIADVTASLFDEDHLDLVGATVTLTNGQAGDILEIGSLPGTMSATLVPGSGLTAAGTITVTLTGTAPLADYEQALRGITFRSTSDNPDVTARIIEFTANDGFDESQTATTTINFISVNDAPDAVDDGPLLVDEDTSITFNPVALNDIDLEGDLIQIVEIDGLVITPGGALGLSGGILALDGDGVTLTYTPPANFFGPVSFDYTISDGSLTDTATVSLDVVPVNDAPIAVDDGPVVLAEDMDVFFDPVVANDSDVENDALEIVAINGQPIAAGVTVMTTDGEITLGSNGTQLHFRPSHDFYGQSQIIYTLSDGTDTSEATVTFDVTPVDDVTVLSSVPPNLSLQDGEIVNLPMAGYFDDPDDDPLLYVATGLPAGLSINSATGVISGVVDSSASQIGTYSIVLSADDGLTSVVTTGFDIEVTNTVPVSAGNSTVVVMEGEAFNIDVASMFVDADGDVPNYAALNVPAWASFDDVSGQLSGVVPTDASIFGSIAIDFSVDDGEGGTASLVLTLDPQNVAPVVIGNLTSIDAREGEEAGFDASVLFADGGNDADTLVFGATGLPDGMMIDPVSGLVSGAPAIGSGSAQAYVVTLTADDLQGGVASAILNFRVGVDDFQEDEDPFADIAPLDVFADAKGSGEIGRVSIDDFVDGIESLGGTTALDAQNGVLLSAIGAIDPLHEATLAGSDGGVPDQIDAIDALIGSTNWLVDSGREGNGDWHVGGVSAYSNFLESKAERDAGSRDERLSKIGLASIVRGDEIYLEFKHRLDPMRDGVVVRTKVSMADGSDFPEWIKLVREGFLTLKAPGEVNELQLELSVTLGSGNELVTLIEVDVTTGNVAVIEEAAPAKKITDADGENAEKVEPGESQANGVEKAVPGPTASNGGELRGTVVVN